MSRPEAYQRLYHYRAGNLDRIILGTQTMYTIKSDDCFITLADDRRFGNSPVIKYKRFWFSNRKQAENHCNRLARMCPSRSFEVVEVCLEPEIAPK